MTQATKGHMRRIRQIMLIEPEPPGFHVFSLFKMPRLGLPILGAILRQQGYQIKIHIGALNRKEMALALECDLIGLSTTTSTAPEAYRLADTFRHLGKLVVIGGVHATFLPEEALNHADYVVRGEGEDTFQELIKCLEQGDQPTGVRGVSYRENGEPKHNADVPLLPDLDRLPFPDFSMLTSRMRLGLIPIQASRGCPFPCNFCSVTKMFGRKVRFRSSEHVLEEIRQISKPEVFFYDDNFCAKPEYTKNLLQGILREGLTLKYFSAQVRAEVARDNDLMDLMSRAGCRQVYVGYESVNPASLAEYDKRQTVDEIRHSMEVFRRRNIRVHGMFVIGSDQDTARTARETLRFARRQHIDTVQLMMLTPLPGTDYYQQLSDQGRIISRDWSLYDAHHAVFLPRRMSPAALQKTTIKAMTSFYSWAYGLRALARLKFWRASTKFMGWYVILRWKWENRGWLPELRNLSLRTQRNILSKRLRDLQGQLEGVLNRGLPQVTISLERLRGQAEVYRSEINRLGTDLVSAVEKDLVKIDHRIEELSKGVSQIIAEVQGILDAPKPQMV